MDGLLLLDKPRGVSSNAALVRARRALGARKAGHGGTLDPMACGLLVVALGEATKFAGWLLDADKEYTATLKLGERTDTGDAEGQVVESGPANVPAARLQEVLPRFRGEQEQVPPMYSALKRDGVPLYKLARKGEEVARAPRRIAIRELEVLRLQPPELEIRVRCTKGTYIRVLAEDLARSFGTVAHLTALRRTGAGRFRVADAVGLAELEALPPEARRARVLGLPAVLADFPRVDLQGSSERAFLHGQAVPVGGPVQARCAVFGAGGVVLGLGRVGEDGRLSPERLVSQAAGEQKIL